MMNMIPQTQINAALEIMRAVADCIKELGRVPSGELYARLMDKMDINTYNRIIERLTKAGLIEVVNHEIIWKDPKKVKDMIEDLKCEILMRQADLELEIDRTIDLLKHAKKNNDAHLASNLAARAVEISELTGKLEANRAALRALENK